MQSQNKIKSHCINFNPLPQRNPNSSNNEKQKFTK